MFDYWTHNFNTQLDLDVYQEEFFDNFHENHRIASYLSKLSIHPSYLSFMPHQMINQVHPFLIKYQPKLISLFDKYKSQHELITLTDKTLKVSSMESIDIEEIDTIFNYMLHDMNLFNEDYIVDPFYGHYFQYYKKTELPYQWHKFPSLSPDYIHIRFTLLINIENASNKDTMQIMYDNTLYSLKMNTYLPFFANLSPYSIVNKKHNYLTLSFGVHIPIKLYIERFFKKKHQIINDLICNEKIINSRLELSLPKNINNQYGILLRNVDMYIPHNTNKMYSNEYFTNISNMFESYIRALMISNYMVSSTYHHCNLFQSIPHKIIDDKLKLLIQNVLEKEKIKYQSYDVNFGICYKDGFYLFPKQSKHNSCKKSILFIESGSTSNTHSYLYMNDMIHEYQDKMYYIIDNLLYGLSVVKKDSVIFMEIIPI
jgi:hypothetical protein